MLILSIFLFIITAVTGYHLNQRAMLVRWYWPALAFKLAAGIGVGLIYHYYYPGGDTINYYHDGLILVEHAQMAPFSYLKSLFSDQLPASVTENLLYTDQPRALLMAKSLSIVLFLSGYNYFLAACWLSLMAFFALFYMANRLAIFFPCQKYPILLAFFVWPSSTLWSSGILKETLTLTAISLLTGTVLPYVLHHKEKNKLPLLLVPFLGYFLWKLKYYYAGAFFAVVGTTWLTYTLREHFLVFRKTHPLLWWNGIFLLFLLSASQLHPNLHPSVFLEAVVINHDLSVIASDHGDSIQFSTLKSNLISFAFNLPEAVFSGLFRPLPTDAQTTLQVLASIEKCILLILCLTAVSSLRNIMKSPYGLSIWACLLYVGLLSTLLAFASPNFGSLLRYQSIFMPWLVFLCLCALNNRFNAAVRLSRRTSHDVSATSSQYRKYT